MRPVIDFEVQGQRFYFDVREDYTKLQNDENSDTELFIDTLKDVLSDPERLGYYPVKDKITRENINVIILDGKTNNMYEMRDKLKIENALIIVKNADIPFNKNSELRDFIIRNAKSVFVLESKEVVMLDFSFRMFASVHKENHVVGVVYYDDYKFKMRKGIKPWD